MIIYIYTYTICIYIYPYICIYIYIYPHKACINESHHESQETSGHLPGNSKEQQGASAKSLATSTQCLNARRKMFE